MSRADISSCLLNRSAEIRVSFRGEPRSGAGALWAHEESLACMAEGSLPRKSRFLDSLRSLGMTPALGMTAYRLNGHELQF